MAAHDWRGRMLPSLFVIVFVLFIQVSRAVDTPSLKEVEKLAADFDSSLRESCNQMFNIVNLNYNKKSASSSGVDVRMSYEDIDESILVKEMAERLSEMMHKKMQALANSVSAAETAAAAFVWMGGLEKDDVHYENSKELLQKGVDLTYTDQFGKEVNFNISTVHIPVEIYDGDIEILNGLNWTSALEEQFKKNYEDDPEILWQYFGSQTGFMRFYPGTAWPRNGVDLYDVRRQSWYTQGSSSPKDMMILIDTSGSTHGQSLQLMQNAVKSILDTLGENDFVNIVAFAEQANFVSKCFNHTAFVQANFRNKKQLEKDIDKLSASGQADFSEALRFAFEKFDEFARNETNDENNLGANCNKVIMLLTDGGTDNARDVFKEYNWPNKTVRVFTYAVGPTPNPITAIKWMACANRGYFSQIPAMGAIRARVQTYTEHLTEMMEITGESNLYWEVTKDPRGLGMMTTVTLPVYNRSLGSSNQTILGVMGIDVTTKKLEAKTPFSKIGPNGYSFAINPNGYVVFHPNLKTDGEFMNEPPNIDLLELEVDQEGSGLQKLRDEMIQGKTDKMVISTLFLSPDRRYVTNGQSEYAFTKIDGTTFRLGISVPTYQKKYPNFSGDITQFDWSNIDTSAFKVLIAPWDYHKNMSLKKDLTGTIDDVVDLLKEDPNPDHWNLDLLYHLYWDVKSVEPELEQYLKINSSDSSNGTAIATCEIFQPSAVFIMTNGGMTMVYPQEESGFIENDRDPRTSSLYKRALLSPRIIFVADYTAEKRSNTSETPFITVARGIVIEQNNSKNQPQVIDKPAVVGERVSHDEVLEILNKKNAIYCQDPAQLLCYLIDDGGFLVVTNREDSREQIGRFFGKVDPTIFGKMNGEIFGNTVQYDFQATCKKQEDTVSAGFKDFHIPSITLLFDVLNAGWWTSKVSWLFTSFNFYSWFNSPVVQAYDEEDDDEKACVKATTQYYVKDGLKPYSDNVVCSNCTREFSVVKLASTNLLLIVGEPMCEECEEEWPPVEQAPHELSDEEEENVICEMARNPRKRMQAYTCYHQDPREDASECGCAGLRASFLTVFLISLSVMWRWTSALR